MRQFVTIASNAFMELVRQPIFLLLMTSSAVFELFLAAPFYFAFGDEPKLVKNSTLAVMLLAGLFGAVISASSSLAREIRTGTALAVLSKPVGRAQFLIAKFTGLIAALTLLTYVNLLTALLASRMAFDAYGSTDLLAVGIFMLCLVIAYVMGAFSNFFLRRPFVSDAVFGVLVMITIAFVVINFYDKEGKAQAFATGVDWRLVPAGILVLFALWVLAGLALACSTRFDIIPTLAICSAIFMLGIMSDYLFGRRAEPVWTTDLQWEVTNPRWTPTQQTLLKAVLDKYDKDKDGKLDYTERLSVDAADKGQLKQAGMGGTWWAGVLYAVTPNWQVFWMADTLDGENPFPWSYLAKAFAYASAYLAAVLMIAVVLFEDRELS
jgi:ABC-type transport system involved in multi-copper enzyme maturation permease subunit